MSGGISAACAGGPGKLSWGIPAAEDAAAAFKAGPSNTGLCLEPLLPVWANVVAEPDELCDTPLRA